MSEPKINYLGPASEAAITTLQGLGYAYNGGQQWKPPLGKKPDFDQVDILRAERDALQLRLNAADQRIDDLEHDKARIDWLADQPVDTLYLDDGRIIDIAGRIDLRAAIDAAIAEPRPVEDEDDHQIPGTSGMRLNMLANQGE